MIPPSSPAAAPVRARFQPVVVARGPLVALAALAAVSLVLRVFVAWRPTPELVLKALPDDAFYYFKGAENIANGLGASLDGRTSTNGFHPLWMAVLVPFFRLFDRDLAVHLALTLTALLDTASVVLVYVAAHRLTRRTGPALLAAAFYGLNPVIVLSAVNGMESALVVFTALLLLNLYLWMLRPGGRRGPLAFVTFGVLAGLAFLARTDGVFLAGALFLAAAVAVRPFGWKGPALALVVAAIVVAPWFAWSQHRFGTPFQVSGEAATWAAHRQFDPSSERPLRDDLGHGANRLRQSLGRSLAEDYFYHRPWLAAALLTLGVAASASAFAGGVRRPAFRWLRRLLPLLPPTLAFFALLVAHDGVRWHVREWYFVLAVPLAALWLALVVAGVQAMVEWWPRRGQTLGVVLVAALAVAFLVPYAARGREDWRQGRYYWQTDNLQAARWMDENLPPDAVVGSFNAGVLAWFDGRSTVNLDGVMNREAYDALRDRHLVEYADAAGITQLADTNWMLFTLYGPYWAEDLAELTDRLGPDPVASFYTNERVSRFGTVTIYRYQPAGSD